MSYTIWMDGTRIGETDLELRHGARRRAGIFHPTEFGLSVLPGISAMAPALLDVGRMCRKNGVLPDPDDLEFDAEKVFETAEGQRVLAAARQISRLELRDAAGKTVACEWLLISDINELATAARRFSGEEPAETPAVHGEPVRYIISTTLSSTHFMRRPTRFGSQCNRRAHPD